MRAFAKAWPDSEFVQEALARMPWYHHRAGLDFADALHIAQAAGQPFLTPTPAPRFTALPCYLQTADD